ncbi:aminopeptidase N [uncultured Desulfobulbus sp.]|uniref:aminopeptidase N n=1 Tax=uncultured Desulfobulbus sp. TaxID=239745 RepID=UPI0029C650AE|nr:aminopeptidase N [uncultured Desulfobulbus sp.]
MTTHKKETFLKDYAPPTHLVDRIDLRVELEPQATRVQATLHCRPNTGGKQPLVLNAKKLELVRVMLDGTELAPVQFRFADGLLEIPQVPDTPFSVEIETRINPAGNTALEGLYLSSGNYCTQCEPEGFRTIACFPDHPDVMSVFTTTVIGDKTACPVLLSNGNLIDSGDLGDGRHFATWHDPFPKPCYLFALVAGNLVRISDTFTTHSGRKVDLHIYVEKRNQSKCDHAMRSLQKAMQWDEERFGREYDLDTYMIVAVDDFNMGAMENKGLNVFNSKYVLALPETATDVDYEGIEAVIAHEYFHNWTGNRITCRDWFQLSLKEGLTVFRDQEFTADMTSRPVKRIQDANIIRSFQFREDGGPMAHPVRPPSFVEINNFYTLTVYNKGAEVIRMLHTLLGPKTFRRGMDLYFERHDGQAVTCDDFVAAMETAWGKDLTQFKCWYSQAGTPELTVAAEYNHTQQQVTLQVVQTCPPTRESAEKLPFFMPLAVGLLDETGNSMILDASENSSTKVLILTEKKQAFVFPQIAARPTVSFLRDFSAPVKVVFEQSDVELSLMMAHDPDPFNRWDAGQKLALHHLLEQIERHQRGESIDVQEQLVRGLRNLLLDQDSDPAFLAMALVLPSENWIGQQMEVIDPVAIFTVRQQFRALIAQSLRQDLLQRYESLRLAGPYRYSAFDAGKRALRNGCLAYLLAPNLDGFVEPSLLQKGLQQYREADNMTDSIAALSCVINADLDAGTALLADFHTQWQYDPLVVDKWLILQAGCTLPGTLDRIKVLTTHPSFTYKNPNKVRSLIATFCATNHGQFHAADGSGYTFLGDQVCLLDELNPQIASRMITPLTQWRRYNAARQQLMRQQLERIGNQESLSDDVREVVEKSLH